MVILRQDARFFILNGHPVVREGARARLEHVLHLRQLRLPLASQLGPRRSGRGQARQQPLCGLEHLRGHLVVTARDGGPCVRHQAVRQGTEREQRLAVLRCEHVCRTVQGAGVLVLRLQQVARSDGSLGPGQERGERARLRLRHVLP